MSSIYLTAIGSAEEEVFVAVEICLQRTFDLEIRRAPPFPDPEYARDPKSRQYSSGLIVRELVGKCPADASRLLGITERDLFIPMLTFVFGQAQLGGKAAVLSLARLRQEFYHLPPNFELLKVRAAKEALHELGHTFGLVHCPDRDCVMSLATNVSQLDRKGGDFCPSCAVSYREKVTMVQKKTADPAGREVLR